MSGYAERQNKEDALKRTIEAVVSRKRIGFPSAPVASLDTDPVIDMERENQRLQRLLGELLLKNQQLRTELAARESSRGNREI